MYLYMGLIAVIPGVIYFTYFINRFLREILNIHTTPIYVIIIGIIVLFSSLPAINTLNLYGVVYYHLLIITVMLEGLNFILKKYALYRFIFTSGLLSLLITSLVFIYGYWNTTNIIKTTYNLSSDKIDDLKIIQIADLHMSTTMSVEELKKYCQEMSQLDADIVFLVGDIFDENTPLEAMIEASKELGKIKNNLGVYYVYGNHDSVQYEGMDFGYEEIKENLKKNGIHVLDDEVICLDNINIIGRKDASFYGTNPRLSTESLYAKIPIENQNNYTVLLDHQPLDLEINAKVGIDLQLSGHSHGGQLFPMRQIQTVISNKLIMGQRDIDDFTAITTSGIAAWRYPIKTGAPCEYVVINVK